MLEESNSEGNKVESSVQAAEETLEKAEQYDVKIDLALYKETFQTFKDQAAEMTSSVKSEAEECIKVLQRVRTETSRVINKAAEAVNDTRDIVESHREFLDKIGKTNEYINECMINVLMAIKQNEYLQAYYPAQSGYPEMKVVGLHPKRAKKYLKEKNE